ncbi:hypothetical protein BGZ50_001703, partial [Haplosporangium sp. Z 11]
TNVQLVLERLSQRSHQSRAPIPPALSPKFKGEDGDMTFAEFRSKLYTQFLRFPESLSSDEERVNYALQSMEGPPAQYFAPYVNGEVPDDEGILLSYPAFTNVLEEMYGDQYTLEEVQHKLNRLRQTGSMSEYLTKFRVLSARSGWNEDALLFKFKNSLSDDVKNILTPQWHTLTTLRAARAAANTAYQNLQAQQ